MNESLWLETTWSLLKRTSDAAQTCFSHVCFHVCKSDRAFSFLWFPENSLFSRPSHKELLWTVEHLQGNRTNLLPHFFRGNLSNLLEKPTFSLFSVFGRIQTSKKKIAVKMFYTTIHLKKKKTRHIKVMKKHGCALFYFG